MPDYDPQSLWQSQKGVMAIHRDRYPAQFAPALKQFCSESGYCSVHCEVRSVSSVLEIVRFHISYPH